ncbi:MAG: DUF4340 domain-containing protein [Ruminococcaceae bacterium]|nr:DUF4340 domain-containing protein [Oscillospiraceae bacterium]
MLKKQKKLIIISLIIIAALAAVYFIVISPIINKRPEYNFEPTVGNEVYSDSRGIMFGVKKDKKGNVKWLLYDKTKNKLSDKEYEFPDGDVSFTQLLYPSMEKEDIAEISVHNDESDFGFFSDKDGNFFLTDYVGTVYDADAFSYLVVSSRYPTVYQRMTTDLSNLKQYGLDKESDPAWYEITSKDGRSYKVYIGDLAPTENRYYVMVEGQEAIYLSGTDIDYMLRSKEAYVKPYIAYPVDSNEYYMTERFTLKKRVDDETVIDVRWLEDEERQELGIENYYTFEYPKGYSVNSTNYDTVLQTFVEFLGTETVAFCNVNEAMPEEKLIEYGVDVDSYEYELYYKYKGIENYIYIGEVLKDTETVIDEKTGEETEVETGLEFRYVYSPGFSLIAKVSTDTLKFLNWDKIDYIDPALLSHLNIDNCKSIAISGEGVDEFYTLKGESTDMTVDVKSTDTTIKATETENFRRLYSKLLYLSLKDYSQNRETDDLMMSLTVTTRKNVVTEYKFYKTSATHCFFTINGEGEFYVLKRHVAKILEDVVTLAEGGDITDDLD